MKTREDYVKWMDEKGYSAMPEEWQIVQTTLLLDIRDLLKDLPENNK
jgi:hypothetical protein